MKSNKPNKSIGQLADQEINTDQIQGGKGLNQKRAMKGKHIPEPDCGIPKHESVTSNNQQLGQ